MGGRRRAAADVVRAVTATLWPAGAAGAAASVVAAAGDIACAPADPATRTTCRQMPTSNPWLLSEFQARDARHGIREFVVGTGGRSLDPLTGPFTNGQFRQRTHFGVLKLTLHPHRYEWRFVSTAKRVLDRGETGCH